MNKRKATSPGIRWKQYKYLKPKKYNNVRNLLSTKKNNSGRNNKGVITINHRGSKVKRIYRIIDFKRNKIDIPAIVNRIEYDPNRNYNIALVIYNDGEKRYIPELINMNIGDKIISSIKTNINIGNCMLIKNIPIGINICCIEEIPGRGAIYNRSAGCYSKIIKKENKFSVIKLNSNEIKKINNYCRATIGVIGNKEYKLSKLGKAGTKRLLGFRPKVRGVAMNPIDHPHGGGEGKTSTKRNPVNKFGILTKGLRTRKNKASQKRIVKFRYEKK